MAIDNQGSSLGLFFTAHNIVAVELRAVRGGIEVLKTGVTDLPRGAIEENTIADAARLGLTIRALLRKIGCTARSAHVALFSPGYSMRVLRMPDVPVSERRQLVRNELEVTNVLASGGGAFDFVWISPSAQSGDRHAEVYAYHAADSMVEGVKEAIQQAGLRLAGLEPASLAMIRAYLAAGSKRRPLAFLCPAERYSDLCLHDGQKIQHIRRIPGGWEDYAPEPSFSERNDYTTDSDLAPGIGYTRDDVIPLTFDIGGPNPPQAAGNPEDDESLPLSERLYGAAAASGVPPQPEAAAGAQRIQRSSSTAFLASEIARTLAFCAREYPTTPAPEAIAVLGVGPVIDDFRRALTGSVPLPFADVMSNAFGIALPSDEAAGSSGAYLAAIGAAIGKMEPTCPQLDISHQEKVATTRQRAPAMLLAGMSIGTVWAILSAVAAITLSVLVSNSEQRSVQVAQELETLKQQRAPLLRGQAIQTAIDADRAHSEVPAPPVLGCIAAAATPGVALTGLRITGDGKVALDGHARDTVGIQRFAGLLGQGHAVRTPVFEMMRQDPTAGLQFRIAGSWTAAPAQVAQSSASGSP